MNECQPCENYKPKDDYYAELYNCHQCIECLDGTVRFCSNCFFDHHDGGYESCKPTATCWRNHPVCVQRWEEYNLQFAGVPNSEFTGK